MDKTNVILVEDSDNDIELIKLKLLRFNPEYVILRQASDALDLTDLSHYDFALVNLKLSGDTRAGLEVIRKFRQISIDLPIFVVTGVESDEMRRSSIEAGAQGVFQKPFTDLDSIQVLRTIELRVAAVQKTKAVKKSWRTSVWGALAIAAGAVVITDFGPLATKIAGCVGTIANGIGLMMARDQKEAEKHWKQYGGRT